jgi:phytoene dehydrogenase-like protein
MGAGNLALLLGALFRVSTYCDDPERMSAGVALHQLKLGLTGNVWYLDGGWQTLVDGLREKAASCGAEFRTRARVEAVKSGVGGVSVHVAGGEELRARTAVLAVEPEKACELLDLPVDSALARWTASSVPIRAACLDLAMSRLPRPENRFALGLDRPLYYSVHSAAAKLAPEGVAVVHVMKYLGNDTSASSQAVELELERLLDQLQPGWKAHTMARRFLPGMTVAHGLPRAHEDGLLGRPAVAVPERPNVFLAGDWVGPLGMLADASAASAAESARRVLSILERAPSIERSSLHVTT